MANLIQILTTLENMSSIYLDTNTDQNSLVQCYGVSTLLLWVSLNKYLYDMKDYKYIPGTLLNTSRMVFDGLVGTIPVALGICYFTTTQFYMLFRFKDAEATLFTMLYVILGDTFFDTLYGCYSVNIMFTIFFAIGWINYGIFFIH